MCHIYSGGRESGVFGRIYDTDRSAVLFVYRMYIINSVSNPPVYALMNNSKLICRKYVVVEGHRALVNSFRACFQINWYKSKFIIVNFMVHV